MSNEINRQLLERAADLIDRLDSHPSGLQKQLIQAVENSDLDNIYYWVSRLEAELAQEHFSNQEVAIW